MDLGAYFVTLTIRPDGLSVYCSTTNLPLRLLRQRRRANKRINPFLKANSFLPRLFITKNKIILTTARIILTAISHAASGPAPKTIGIGPIKMTPPTLPDPPKTTIATTKTAMPTKTKAMPKIKKPKSRLETADAFILSFFIAQHSSLPQKPIIQKKNN